jgi:hypothetical protein
MSGNFKPRSQKNLKTPINYRYPAVEKRCPTVILNPAQSVTLSNAKGLALPFRVGLVGDLTYLESEVLQSPRSFRMTSEGLRMIFSFFGAACPGFFVTFAQFVVPQE